MKPDQELHWLSIEQGRTEQQRSRSRSYGDCAAQVLTPPWWRSVQKAKRF